MIDTGTRNSTIAAFILSAILFACLFLTGCGGGDPDQDDPAANTVAEQQPDNRIPTNPCKNPEACK